MTPRLRRAALLVAALLLLAAGVYRWPLSSAFVASHIGPRDWPASVVMRGPGRASLSLLPSPVLRLVDAEWRGPDGASLLTAQHADIRIGLLPLLAGRFEIVGATLRQATAFIDLDAQPVGAPATNGANTIAGAARWPGEVTIQQGLIHVSSAARNLDVLIGDVEGSFNYAGPNNPLSASLRATWRDEPMSISLQMARPARAPNGAAASLSIASDKAWIKFDGDIVDNASLHGSLNASIPGSTPLKRLLGLAEDAFVPLQDVALEGEVLASSSAVQLTQAHLSIGKQRFDGALTLELAASGAALSGTLAGDSVNLDKFFANAPELFDASGGWSDAPFNLPRLSALAVDLRLSAARLSWRGHPFDSSAIALLGRNGEWTVSLLEAGAWKGMLKGELRLTRRGAGLALRASANLANADIGALLGEFGVHAVSGQGGGEFTLETEGNSIAALVRGLSGEALIRVAGGAIEGVSFEEALRRSARRSIDPASDMRMGRTVFAEASASLKIAEGRAHIRAASLSGPGVNVGVVGALDLVKREIEARAIATQTNSLGAPTPDGQRLVFDLDGPWTAPRVAPGGG